MGEQHDRWLHTIGNLTLTAYNAELGNAPFSEKKRLLKDSKFSLTKSLLERTQWKFNEIRTRGEMLAGHAVSVWGK